MYTIAFLLKNSNLPGHRGNLELLYTFSKTANNEIVRDCLGFIKPDTSNSPEEFAGMCGILGYAQINKSSTMDVLAFLRQYASHKSWRIREAVAMAIQELSAGKTQEVLKNIQPWIQGNFFEQRAIVAGFCEPKLLTHEELNREILITMRDITQHLDHNNKLDDSEKSLRKALAYGWSNHCGLTCPRQGTL